MKKYYADIQVKEKKILSVQKKVVPLHPISRVNHGVLAQVARAFDWQSKGHRFDSDILHQEGRYETAFFLIWGISSSGRAFGSQSKGNRFESDILHNLFQTHKSGDFCGTPVGVSPRRGSSPLRYRRGSQNLFFTFGSQSKGNRFESDILHKHFQSLKSGDF